MTDGNDESAGAGADRPADETHEGGAGGEDAGRATDEERLSAEIREELQELEELRDRHLRLAAEFDNYRKRTRRELSSAGERARADLAREILEVLDDLERIASNDPASATVDSLHEAVVMVERKLRKTLEDAGVTRIEAAGQAFDPELHEALTSIPTDDPDRDGRVAEVITEGYRFGDRLLRPAQVAVHQLDD